MNVTDWIFSWTLIRNLATTGGVVIPILIAAAWLLNRVDDAALEGRSDPAAAAVMAGSLSLPFRDSLHSGTT